MSSPRSLVTPALVTPALPALALALLLSIASGAAADPMDYALEGSLALSPGPDGVFAAPVPVPIDAGSLVLDSATGQIVGIELLASTPVQFEAAPGLTLTLSDLRLSAGVSAPILSTGDESLFQLDPLVLSATLSGLGASQLLITEGTAKGSLVWSPEQGLVSFDGIGTGTFREVLSSLGGEGSLADLPDFDLALQVGFATRGPAPAPGEAVPEPSAALVFGLGLGTVAAWSRRRR